MWIGRKHCTVNVRNYNDDKCFQYSVLALAFPPAAGIDPTDPESYRPHEHHLNMEGMTSQFVTLDDIKDENSGDPILEVAAIKPKQYSILTKSGYEKKTAKGITSVAKDRISHQDYVDCIKSPRLGYSEQRLIQSKNHVLELIMQTKLSLNPLDDKRYTLANGMDTLAHGHCRAVYGEEGDVSEEDEDEMIVGD